MITTVSTEPGEAVQKIVPIPILMYHSISDKATHAFKQFTVPPDMFERQLNYLVRNNYVPLTVTQLVTAMGNSPETARPLPDRPVLLTFDDGFEDFYINALPALQRYGLTATLYTVAGFVGETSRWLKPEGEELRKIVSWSQLVEISRSGIECGSHSLTHPQLDLLPVNQAWQEIWFSKGILEERLGKKILSFCYPHGYHNPDIEWMVKKAGYTSACAVKNALSSTADEPFALARRIVKPDTDETALEILLTRPDKTLIAPLKRLVAPAWRWKRRLAQGGGY